MKNKTSEEKMETKRIVLHVPIDLYNQLADIKNKNIISIPKLVIKAIKIFLHYYDPSEPAGVVIDESKPIMFLT